MPAGVHLAVVDPDVGARRRALALRTAEGDRLLVGPDNGLLIPAAERFGGVAEAVEISLSPWRLEPVSATFHGRDLFAPVAARLAAGEALADAGTPLDAGELVRFERTEPRVEGEALVAHVVASDTYGNAILDATHDDLVERELRLGDAVDGARAVAARPRRRRAHVRRGRAGRPAALRGRGGRARPGRQRRRRDRAARPAGG